MTQLSPSLDSLTPARARLTATVFGVAVLTLLVALVPTVGAWCHDGVLLVAEGLDAFAKALMRSVTLPSPVRLFG